MKTISFPRKNIPSLGGALALLFFSGAARANDGQIIFSNTGSVARVQIVGDNEDDWRLQASTDLTNWITLTNFGTLLSDKITNAPSRVISSATNSAQFFRALQTEGLYDPTLFRTVSLTFTQANWGSLLTSARTTGIDILGTLLTLDNGASNVNFGARYKGNTSFSMAGTKKSINLDLDFTNTEARLMGFKTVNLNNAAADETIMREPLYFYVMNQYTPCPLGSMARVNINGALWGVYSLVEQENSDLIKRWFPSNDGDRFRAPNIASGGGFVSSNSAFGYFGTNWVSYTNYYELKTDNTSRTNAFLRLATAITALNTTPTNNFRASIEDFFAVDSWLWFLAIENIFTDDDSYWNKGADYAFYYEVESGRIHPLEHDGNEAFTVGDTALSPFVGYNVAGVNARTNNRPILAKFLVVPELRQRYLAHMRTVLQENYNPTVLTPVINRFHSNSIATIILDPNKNFTLTAYTNDLIAVKTYITNRYNYLMFTNVDVKAVPPNIVAVYPPTSLPTATQVPFVTAQVAASGTNGLDSVWLYFRGLNYGKFTQRQMFDDGAHGDGAAGDGIFGAATTNYPASSKVRYYIEARSANTNQAASFSPVRAEQVTDNYRVGFITASNSPVVINEFMADNTAIADPQGQFDDWIELRNTSEVEVDLTGKYLSDSSTNLRKWPFPNGTKIPANGFLVVWADENSADTPGLHANFKLSKSGEEVVLTDSDVNANVVLDAVTFGAQTTDLSYGRSAANPDVFTAMTPTIGVANQ